MAPHLESNTQRQPPQGGKSSRREMQQVVDDESTCCSSEECLATAYSNRPELTRMAISASAAPQIQAYLTAYEASLEENNRSSSQIHLSVLPSYQELQQAIRLDAKTRSGLYDGYITLPMMMGDLLEQESLATIPDSVEGGDSVTNYLQDLLPYYRTQISTLDGKTRGIPLLAGNQPLLVYRKDYLDAFNLPIPVTWGEYVRVAAALHDEALGPDGGRIYGSCWGRLTEAACRSEMDQQPNSTCNSMSMSYIGMMLASMTQVGGTSSGWLFDDDTSTGMKPLLNPALERVLVFMEQQLKFGAPNELESDSSLNLELFRQGQCAMTVTLDHPTELFSDPNVGLAPIPGSHNFFARQSDTMVDCTPDLCPFGVKNEVWGTVNYAPFGATDMMVGTVSTFASSSAVNEVMKFFRFIIDHDPVLDSKREQPLTYSGLSETTIDGYEGLMLNITESKNVAAPLRIPNSFGLWSELDNQVYDYLVAGDYTPIGRQQVRERVEVSWQQMILQHDSQSQSIPTSIFYEMSLGVFEPESTADFYIGKTSRIIGWTLGGLSCFLSLYFALWVWRYQNTRVVRSSQTIFLYMICFGTLLMAGSIFLFGVEDDIANTTAANRSCMGSMWLYGIGYVITFTPLASKVGLVNRIFRKARNMQRIKLEGIDILKPLLIIGGINVIILTTWNVTDPVVWVRSPVYEVTSTLNIEEVATYGYCNSDHYRVYLGMMLGINYVVAVVALVQAYECRKVSTDYGEFLWIGAAIIAIVQLWSVGLPLLKLLDEDPRAVFFVKVGVVFLTSMCTQLLIFIPKIGYLRQSMQYPGLVEDQGHELRVSYRDPPSVTSHESEDSPYKEARKMPASSGAKKGDGSMARMKELFAPEGIRIIQTNTRHSEELEKLRKGLRHAESRHKSLNERLERLQEKLEQYIVSRHPNHGMHGSSASSNFILSARSEQVKLSG